MGQSVPAEGGFGDISGTIFEASGRPAALVNVTLVHQETGLHRQLVTDKDGKYQASHLPAGSYSLVVGSVRTGASSGRIVLGSGANVDLRTDLTTSPREIPLRDRDYLDLVHNATEATRGEEGGNIEGYTPLSPRGNSSLNIVGQRGQSNNFLLDGMDNNEVWLGADLLRPSLEAIQ